MKKEFDYYRIKTEWTRENENGSLEKVKTEELVYASSYSEAESAAYAMSEDQERSSFNDIDVEIVKTKITELLYNHNLSHDDSLVSGLVCNYFEESEETGVGLYAVKVVYIIVDEETDKKKISNEIIHVPASSNTNAAGEVQAYLKKMGETRDYIIRDIKFDKAEAILWPPQVHQEKVSQLEK